MAQDSREPTTDVNTVDAALDDDALDAKQYDELLAVVRGAVHLRGSTKFTEFTTMFNGNVQTAAKAVALPLDAQDVSSIVLFCLKHSLSPSVKAGGYGTAGWAVGGDIVIDLRLMVDADIEVPGPHGEYTGLADMCPPTSKGKAVTGKRRREEQPELKQYHLASEAVESFLKGPSAIKRRLDEDGNSAPSRQDTPSSSSNSPPAGSNGSATSDATSHRSWSVNTSSSSSSTSGPSRDHNLPFIPPPSNADPFGYITTAASEPQHILPASTPASTITTWSSGVSVNNPFNMGPQRAMAMDSTQVNILAPPTPIHPHAFVTFGSGMLQKQIDIYTAENAIEAKSVSGARCTIPYHVPFAAHPVGSSIMLLGGFGFLGRLHGLSVDNLVEVEMVLADGTIAIANEDSHPDLFWAVRGAGPSFGIATRYKAKAFPVPHVFAGNIIYRFHRSTAASLIKHFRDCVKGAPRELYANVLLTAGPEGKDSLVVIQMCYVGTKEKGQEFLAAISSWTGDTCLLNEVDEKSFLHQQDSVAQVLRAKAGRQWFIRSALITSLPDEVVHQTVIQFADTPTGCTWLFELAGGKIADIDGSCIPKAQREATFTIAALHQWEMGVDDPRCIESAEEWIADTLLPHQTGGPFPSFLGRHEPPERIMACYGEKNFERLKEIKKKYDPENFFCNNLWPLRAEGEMGVREPASPPFDL